MIKFIFEIPVKIKHADGSPFLAGMGQRQELESKLVIEVDATDSKAALVALESGLAKLAKT